MEILVSIMCALITAASAIIVAIINNRMKKDKAIEEKREERRKKESLLQLQMTNANMELSVACCNALCGGHNNGNVKRAWEKAEAAAQAYKQFEHELVMEEIA